jgi:calcineurin-like phosphoesterase family protein
MKFRDDIDIDKTWAVSDTHFGHDNIVGFCHRPEDHEQAIIAEWRRVIPDDATVLHLGDLTYKSNAWFKNIIAKELTGARKLLIRGNHDKNPRKFYEKAGFNLVRPFALRLYEGLDGLAVAEPPPLPSSYVVSFSHYPWSAQDDDPMLPTHWRIHGHIHNSGYTRDGFVPFLKNHINLSVEQTRYTPVNLKLLLDAAILGEYPETTQEQLDDATDRKREAMS